MSSSLGLTPVLGTAGDLSDMFAGALFADQEHESRWRKAQKRHERLRDELTDAKSQERRDQAKLIRNSDQCQAETLALATKESQERDVKMTREIE